jgi:NADPH:quinone reductase-like Zn-dependent oxidoreductase
MKAMILTAKSGAEALTLADVPRPEPQAGEVLVQVHATALTPTELQWTPTFTARSGQPRPFPVILGHEFSGVVAEVRGDVGDFVVGDEVYGMNDWFSNGAQAEYCVAPAAMIAAKPRLLDHAQAAAVPISALTAWQALMVRSRLHHGQTILIHGAAGAVGLFAVQIAHEAGAHVIATASAANRALLESLGVDEFIDYHSTRFEYIVRKVDVVFDTQGGETLMRSWYVLKPGGTLVTIAAQSGQTTDRRTREAFMLVEPDQAQLSAISEVIDAGRRRVFVAAEFPLAQAREAYASVGKVGRGKTVLRVIPASATPPSSFVQNSTPPTHV